MFKKILTSAILGTMFFLGGNAMAETTLNARQKSIAAAASYAARGNQAGLKRALTEGLDAGVTVNEFKEILTQVYAYCGFPRSLNALNTLMQLEDERGNKDEQGRLPGAKPEGNSLDYGKVNQTKLTGREVSGKLFDFAPAIDEFLKAHLFGDIFARDNVDWQTRELATIAMLASTDKVESQLNSHINIGKHNGLSDDQIAGILEIADKTGLRVFCSALARKTPLMPNILSAKAICSRWQRVTSALRTLLLNPGAAITGIFITRRGKPCWSYPVAAGIRNGANRRGSSRPAMSSKFPKGLNIGTARPRTAGLRILRFPFPPREQRPNGWSR